MKPLSTILFGQSDTRPLSFLRMATPIIALAELMALWPNLRDIYGDVGYIEWVVSDTLFSVPNLPTMAAITRLLNPELVDSSVVLYLVMTGYILSLLGVLVGYRTRFMALVAWGLHLTINNSANMYGYGVETFIHISLFYLMFMPTSSHWTLLPHRKETDRQRTLANIWIGILRIHLCIVYFNAGLAKMYGDDWTSGEAIWRSVAQPSYGQFDMLWLSDWSWLAIAATWSVLLLETAFPLLMWWKPTRIYGLLGIMAMHVGIGLLMGLHAFAGIMIALNLGAFGWTYVETAWNGIILQTSHMSPLIYERSRDIR